MGRAEEESGCVGGCAGEGWVSGWGEGFVVDVPEFKVELGIFILVWCRYIDLLLLLSICEE